MTQKNNKFLEVMESISPSLLPYVITGAEMLDNQSVTGANGSQVQTVNRRGRPRKTAENGLAEGVQIPPETVHGSGSAPSAPASVDGPKPTRPRGRGRRNGELIPAQINAVEIGQRILDETSDLVFLFSGSLWFQYDENSGWKKARESDVKTFVILFMTEHFPGNYSKQKAADVVEWLQAMWSIDCVQGVHSYFVTRSDDSNELKAVPAPDWISCQNKLINTRTGETRKFTRNLFTLGRVPCDYDPAAVCPRWNQFLEETLDPESAAVLQEFFGVSLTYDRDFQGFAILYGEGGNGKGVVCDLLKEINTGAFCGVSFARMGARFSQYDLTTHRVNIHPDTNSRVNWTLIPEVEEILKATVCGEYVTVEKKGVDPETRQLTALPFFAMNPPFPAFMDRSAGIKRRLRVIHFQKTFVETESENKDLKKELVEELSGILNWSLAGYRRLIQTDAKHFSDSAAGQAVVNDAQKENHPELIFFEEELKLDDWGRIPASTLYSWYSEWYDQNGFPKLFRLNQKAFSQAVAKYFNIRRSHPFRSDDGKIERGFEGIGRKMERDLRNEMEET